MKKFLMERRRVKKRLLNVDGARGRVITFDEVDCVGRRSCFSDEGRS